MQTLMLCSSLPYDGAHYPMTMNLKTPLLVKACAASSQGED
jgi:hypothetical protein